MQEFQRLNSVTNVHLEKRLPCLGLIQNTPDIGPFGKALVDQSTSGVLHRPSEPAGITETIAALCLD